MTIKNRNEGEALRFSLVSIRPISRALIDHTRSILQPFGACESSRHAHDLYIYSWLWDGHNDSELAIELRSPATALGVDSAIISGPMAVDGPGLIVTDVDSTFITSEVIERLAAHAGTEEEVRAITEAAMRGELDFSQSLTQRVATLEGVPATVFSDVIADIELTPGARNLVDLAHLNGAKVALVSGGFSEVVLDVAERGLVDRFIANGLEVSDGKLTGRTHGPVIHREAKIHAVRQWSEEFGVPLAKTVCVGDGANDLGMMEIAGLSVAFCAKPVVVENADCAITSPRLDILAAFFGWL